MKWYSRSRSVPATPRGLPADAIANSPGCMSMVHYLIFAPGAGCVGRPPSSDHHAAIVSNSHHLNSSITPSSHTKGGLEAPRNSLELDGDELRDIQIGVQVEPAFDALAMSGRRSTGSRATAPSSEAGTPRTPSLVARLMGIDGLPDQSSPSPGLKKSNPRAPAAVVKEKKKRVIPESMNRQPLRSLSCNVGAGEARSLPDTPRASASSARSASAWDVVDRPRLSLQVLKENVLDRAAQYMSMPSSPTSASKRNKDKKDGHRRRDAKEHAREIVRQAKETVTNRNKSGGGKKSTSTASASSNKENASPFVVVEDKRMVLVQVQAAPASVKPTTPLLAKVQVAKQQQQQLHAPRLPPPPPPLRAKPSRPPPPPPPPDHPTPPRAAPLSPQAVKCKRPPDGCERFATRIKKPGAGAGAATIQQAAPAAPPCPVPAAPLSFSIAHHHNQRNHHPAVASTSSPRVPVPLEDDPEYGYLRSVLERGGFMRTTPAPSHRPFKGNSVSSPVDPIVFHLLELDLPTDDSPRLGPLRHRWNRKLLFHLTQEILADLLPIDSGSSGPATATSSPALHGTALLGKVWRRVKAFPSADCRVVGDIDELVATDLHASSHRGLERHPAVAEEAGDVADDVAEWVLDALLRESLPNS